MKLFLTGATGFLGHELLRKLHGRGHSITTLVRSPARASFPADVNVIPGAIENPGAYRNALTDHEVFIHVAALVKMWVKDRGQFDRINVEALESAVRAAADAGIGKFVYTSSFIALGPSNGRSLREEDARRTDHFHNDYERTKYLGDQAARRLIDEGYPVYILYPGVIYGPGNLTDGNIVAKNLIPFLNGKMPFGLSLQQWSYSLVDDVINAFVQVIEETPPSRRYILGGDNKDGREFYETVYQVSGKKPPAINIPMPMALAAGYGEYLLAQWFGRQPTLLTHEVVRIYQHSWAYDSTLAMKELNYHITPLKEGMVKMVEWLKNSGHVR